MSRASMRRSAVPKLPDNDAARTSADDAMIRSFTTYSPSNVRTIGKRRQTRVAPATESTGS